MEKNLDWELDELHVSVCSFGSDLIFSGLDVVNDWNFNKRKFKIVPFSVSIGTQAAPEFVELNCVMADINYE
jgi:hypothetical protein